MICKNCHVHLEDDVNICPVCGAAQDAEEVLAPAEEIVPEEAVQEEAGQEELTMEAFDTEAEPETVEQPDEEMEELKPSKRSKWIRIGAIICCAVLVLGLGLGLWSYINGGLMPRKNDLYFKDNYTAKNDEAAVKAADKVIAKVGDVELTNGELQVFYWMEFYGFLEKYGDYMSYMGIDITKPLSEQHVTDGSMTWEQYFLDSALNTWHSYQCLLLAAEAEGNSISADLATQLEGVKLSMQEAALNYDFESADEMVQADMGANTSMDAYSYYLKVYFGGMEKFEQIYNTVSVSPEQIKQYYQEHAEEIASTYQVDEESGKLIDVRHILVTVKGGTTDENGTKVYSDEEWETCRQEAQAILDQWLSGEATEESFALLATQKTEDPGSQTTGGLYTMVYEGQMVPTFNDWCFDESRQPGDYGMVKTNYGYHVMYFVFGEEAWYRYAEQDAMTDLCSEEMMKIIESYPREVNYKKIVLGDLGLT